MRTHSQFIKRYWAIWAQPICFGLIGVLNTATDYLVFVMLFGAINHIATANVISYCCGAAVSFFLNKTITFRSSKALPRTDKSIAMFVLLTVGMIIVSTIATVGFAQFVRPELAKLLSVLIVAGLSFFGMKYFVFRDPRSSE